MSEFRSFKYPALHQGARRGAWLVYRRAWALDFDDSISANPTSMATQPVSVVIAGKPSSNGTGGHLQPAA